MFLVIIRLILHMDEIYTIPIILIKTFLLKQMFLIKTNVRKILQTFCIYTANTFEVPWYYN